MRITHLRLRLIGFIYLLTFLSLASCKKSKFEKAKKAYGFIRGIYEDVKGHLTDLGVFGSVPMTEADEALSDVMKEFFTKMKNVEENVDNVGKLIAKIKEKVANQGRVFKLNAISELLEGIKAVHRRSKYILQLGLSNVDKCNLADFAKTSVSHDTNSIYSILERLDILVNPQGTGLLDTGILQMIVEHLAVTPCKELNDPTDLIWNISNGLTIANLKGNSMVLLAYASLNFLGFGSFQNEVKTFNSNFEKREKERIEARDRALIETEKISAHCKKS